MGLLPRPLRRLAALAMILIAAWLGGLALFVASSLTIHSDPEASTDAIVVLTGGKQRLDAGLALLARGKAKKLFISGVNQRVEREALLRALGPLAEREGCCIVVGHEADNTFGNAQETATWMHEEGYKSLRLVTSWYHVRRSVLEFARAMPQMAILPHPVFAPHVDPERWWGPHGAALLVIGEYHKFLVACLRPLLEAVLPPPRALPPVIRASAEGRER